MGPDGCGSSAGVLVLPQLHHIEVTGAGAALQLQLDDGGIMI